MTTKVGNVELNFTEFLQNKIFSVKPDIIMLEKNAPNPTFDMILGAETLLTQLWGNTQFCGEYYRY